jgi:hypothetical protein
MPDGKLLGRLRATALFAMLVGTVGSVGLMLRAGHPPLFLRVLFVIWVLSPYATLLVADVVSKRWSVLSRAALYVVTLAVTLGSLAVYGADALEPPKAKAALVYVVVPPASCLLMAIVVAIAALLSGRASTRR